MSSRDHCLRLARCAAVVAVALLLNSSAQAALRIGTFDTTRSTDANIATGIYTTQLVASLGTHFPGATFVTTPTLTPAFLSSIDVLFIDSAKTDSVPMTSLSSSEQTAMFNFVKGGGSALLIAEGYAPYVVASQSMVNPFGMTVVDDGVSGIQLGTPTNHTHPVINGPYGDTPILGFYGAGIFTNIGPYAHTLGTMDVNHQPVLVAIESGAISPTSGRVVAVTDSAMFIDDAAGGAFSTFEPLFLNTMTYLATPEPSSLGLAGCALAIGGLVQFWRRAKAH